MHAQLLKRHPGRRTRAMFDALFVGLMVVGWGMLIWWLIDQLALRSFGWWKLLAGAAAVIGTWAYISVRD